MTDENAQLATEEITKPAEETTEPEKTAEVDPQLALLQEQVKALGEQNQLFRMMLEREQPATKATPEADEPDEFLTAKDGQLDPNKLLESDDAISALYSKGIPSKREIAGFVNRTIDKARQQFESQIDERIERRMQKTEQQASVYSEFPELLDAESRDQMSVRAKELIEGAKKRGDAGLHWLALSAAQASLPKKVAGDRTLDARTRAAGGGRSVRGEDRTASNTEPVSPLARALNEAIGWNDGDYVKSRGIDRSYRGSR